MIRSDGSVKTDLREHGQEQSETVAVPATVGGERLPFMPLGNWEGRQAQRPASQETCRQRASRDRGAGFPSGTGHPLRWRHE